MKSPKPQPGYRRGPSQRGRTFIAEWRKFRKLTQEKVAVELETTKATVSRIENGDLPYSQDFLESLADLLGVHQGVLVTRPPTDADRTPPPSEPQRSSRRQ